MSADLLVLGGAFLTGLLGSFHCAAMCGGIAAGFGSARRQVSWSAALEPNFGRVLGYVLAGALAGGIGRGVIMLVPFERIALIMRAAVGLVLVAVALRLLDRSGRLRLIDAPARLSAHWIGALQRKLMPADRGVRRLLAGMLWGWLPCGLSTTVLIAVWLQGDALQGAMTMLAFGAGTLPAMVPLTWSGARLGQSLRNRGLRTGAALVILLAGLLTMAGPWLGHLSALHGALRAIGCRSLS
jgi:sulfite exporter TauE/SafE